MESTVHQLASASVAAIFSISMLLAAHLFSEYRFSRMQAVFTVQLPAATPAVSKLPFGPNVGPLLGSWSNGAL